MAKISLSADEKHLFDSITCLSVWDYSRWGRIHDLSDIQQLRRLERYMREEGFPQTAKVAKERLEQLGEAVDSSDGTHKLSADEIDGILDDLKSWEVAMKSSSRKPDESNAKQWPTPIRKLQNDTAGKKISNGEEKSTSADKQIGKKAYYENWNKWVKEIEQDDQSAEIENLKGVPITTMPAEEARESYSHLSAAEKQWASEREKAKGNELFKAKDYAGAVQSYSNAIDLNPTNDLLFSNRAIAYFKLSDFEKAEADCSTALGFNPHNLKALIRRCNSRLERNNIIGAEEDVQCALQLQGSDKELSKLHSRIEKQKMQKHSHKDLDSDVLDTAKEHHSSTKVVQEPPSQTAASTAATQSRKYDSESGERGTKPAASSSRVSSHTNGESGRKVEIIEIDSDEEQDSDATCVPDSGIESKQNANQATQDSGDAPSMEPRPQPKKPSTKSKIEFMPKTDQNNTIEKLKDEGNFHFKAGRLKEASDCYTRGLEIDDKNAILYSNRALVFYKQAQYHMAEEDATSAIQADPMYSKAFYRRSLARTALGKYDRALEDLTRVKEMLPGDTQVDREIQDLQNIQNKRQREVGDAERAASFTEDSEKELQDSPSVGGIENGKDQDDLSKGNSSHECGHGDVLRERHEECVYGSISTTSKVASEVERDNHEIHTANLSTASRPLDLPKSLLEFERCINEFQGDSQMLARYLTLVEPGSYQALFKEALTAQTLQLIIRSLLAVKAQSMVTDEFLVAALNGLSMVKRLELAAFAVPKQLKVELRSIINTLDTELGQKLEPRVSDIC